MTLHLIVTCVAQKTVGSGVSILDEYIQPGSPQEVYARWQKALTDSRQSPVKASQLYSGALWNTYLDIHGLLQSRFPSVKFWILSAGYGCISGDALIKPYNITFQDPQYTIPSLFAKVKGEAGASKRELMRTWWSLLTSGGGATSLTNIISSSGSDDRFILISGKDYIDAVYTDLTAALAKLPDPASFIVVSNNARDPLLATLKPHWLYADKKFVNLPGANSTTVNATIARELMVNMFFANGGLSWWSLDNFNAFLKKTAAGLEEVKSFDRNKAGDEEIKDFIRAALQTRSVSSTKLHREYRSMGNACEYKRFMSLYQSVKSSLAEEKTPVVNTQKPVVYTKRKGNILFFLPDWDDRVDPEYDFVNEISAPGRNPYEHDAYHYELYGTLSCDGILVSKTVLEQNQTKKNLARSLGIHKYLRLPREVPVLGDCGAFSYIADENPPFETKEILEYYNDMDFDYGVSIDHLIVPGILKKKRFLRLDGDTWNEIPYEEFTSLSKDPATQVLENRRLLSQQKLFDPGLILCEEEYTDEAEKLRRYELTLRNGLEFIRMHKKSGYSFTPIGAVQGWDPVSYAEMAFAYQKAGYEYIALGGLVKSKTTEILAVLDAVNAKSKKKINIHIFGVAREDAILPFMQRGVTSVDSASFLRQAWLSSANNYFTPGFDNYTAVRIPLADSKKNRELMEQKGVEFSVCQGAEQDALSALREYEKNALSVEKVLEKIAFYNNLLDIPEAIYRNYHRTLSDKPWRNCECTICKTSGIEVVIFRGNNRNRRRGFHNTWIYYQWLKSIDT